MDTEELFYPEISDLLDDRDDILLGDRHDRPGLINGIRELCFCDPGLGQTIGDDLLRIQRSYFTRRSVPSWAAIC